MNPKLVPPARLACLAVVALGLAARQAEAGSLDITDYSISDLEAAYKAGTETPVDAVNFYLDRIAKYDQGGPMINSVPVLNPNALADAQKALDLIKSGATTAQYPLLGVPVIVKDSYDVAGMPTTNGVGVLHSAGPGSVTNLVAPQDSFAVAQLRAAGAIIIGKANMSTMAYSYDGISDAYGRVLNPYASDPGQQHTPGGSSSGTGAAIASSFAMFGMGGETGGSIRVPSTNNDLVGLKTSAGLIDPGGTWPLTPSRDVVGPIARNVSDIASAMNALVHPSSTDLWNNTPYYPSGTPQPGTAGTRPTDYTTYLDPNYLQGKVIAIEAPYAGDGKYIYPDPFHPPPATGPNGYPYQEFPVDPQVMAAFNKAVAELKSLGATVVEVNIPAYDIYQSTLGARGGVANTANFPFPFPTTSTGAPDNTWSARAAAYYYEKTIESYHDPVIKNLDDLYNAVAKSPDNGKFYGDLATVGAVSNILALKNTYDAGLASGFGFHVDPTTGQTVADNPDAQKALQAFADLRNQYYEAFMNDPTNPKWGADAVPLSAGITHIDAFTFPTLNYLSPLEAYTGIFDPTSTIYGSLPARFESNILGVPSIAVPMGFSDDGIPMSLEFMGHFDGEGPLIGMAYDYEQHTHFRADPDLDSLPVPGPALFQAAVPAPPAVVLGAIASAGVGLADASRRRRLRRAS
jgi:amidase